MASRSRRRRTAGAGGGRRRGPEGRGDDDIEHKFRLIAKPVLGAAKADKVIALVRRLETLPDIGELVQALRP